jgi:hypothetical protein
VTFFKKHLPLEIQPNDRTKITLLVEGDRLYFKSEFLMDSQSWVIKESYHLTREQSASLAFSILDKAEEIEGPPLKRPRRRA